MKDRDIDREEAEHDRLTRLEERVAFLSRLVWTSMSAGGAAIAGHAYNILGG